MTYITKCAKYRNYYFIACIVSGGWPVSEAFMIKIWGLWGLVALGGIRSVLAFGEAGSGRGLVFAADEIYWKQPSATGWVEAAEPSSSPNRAMQQARSLRQPKNAQPHLVFYQEGEPRNEFSRRILSPDILATLRPGANADAVAAALGARNLGRLELPGNRYRFRLQNYDAVLEIEDRVDEFAEVIHFERQFARLHERRTTLNDTYFDQQWHLQTEEADLVDINLGDVWERYTGEGVVIGILDDGLALDHPDLAPNLEPLHYDFRDGDSDPSPNLLVPDIDDGMTPGEDRHGTAVAGLAAARGNNGIGVSGVAPRVGLAGLRLIGDYAADITEAEAFTHGLQDIDIKNSSWGPPGFGYLLTGPGPLATEALRHATNVGRGGKGTIFVWAAGNGGLRDDDANKDGYVNSPYTIAVGAVDEFGKRTNYSESSASLVVVAPSGASHLRGLATTDLLGNDGYNHSGIDDELDDLDYTNGFGGTSGSAPIVSGVIALMLDANPNLGWRDVQEILMRTARQVDADNAGWFENAATTPFHFNRLYGAGLVDAQAAVDLAEDWSLLAEQRSMSVSLNAHSLPLALPDDDALEFRLTLPAASLRVEHASLRLSAQHDRRGDLDVYLVSPSGTESHLLQANPYDEELDILDFSFNSVQFWGESATGQWTVRIVDRASDFSGELYQATLTLYGTSPRSDLPDTPENLIVTRIAGNVARLSWSDVAHGETGYRIERSINGFEAWEHVATVDGGVTEYTDESLNYQLFYAYRVCAVDGNFYSAYTEPVGSYRAFLETTELYSANFEQSQGYSTGSLDGQNGWWAVNSTTAHVVSSSSMGGEQLLQVGGRGYRGEQYEYVYDQSVYFPDPNSQARITCQLEIDSTAFQARDAFGLAFYNLDNDLLFVLDWDAEYRRLSYYNDDYNFKPLGRTFRINHNYDVEIRIDMNTNTWSLRLDGVVYGSNLKVANSTSDLNGLLYHEFFWYIITPSLAGANKMLIDDYKLEAVASDSPQAPTELDGFAQASSIIYLYWADPFLASHYYVEGRPSGSAQWTEMLSFPVEDWPLPVAVKGLEPDTEYEFRVRAENGYGFSSYSEIATLTSLREYQDWLRACDIEVEASLLDDPYEVGYPLLLSYALGIHPEYFSVRGLPQPTLNEEGDMLTLSYYRARDDVDYEVVASDTLIGPWSPVGVAQDYEVDGRKVTAAVPVPESGSKFLKLLTTLADR